MRPIAAVLATCLAVLCVSDPAAAAHPPPAAPDEGLGLPLPRYDRISSPYGWRVHPILHRPEFHQGVDFAAPAGTPVQASEAGTVEMLGWHGNYGRYVRLRHAGGLRTGYAHLARIRPGLCVGSHVSRGEVIGAVGASGLATGPHLFYEVFDHGRHVDPRTAGLPVAADRSRQTLASVRHAAAHQPRHGHGHGTTGRAQVAALDAAASHDGGSRASRHHR